MKKIIKYLLSTLLVISLICNALLSFYLIQEQKPSPSITKFSFDKHDTVIYCEKSDEINTINLDYNKNIFTIGNAKLLNADDSVYFITPEDEINLSDYDGLGFVINSNGELLYSLNTPAEKQEIVYITPSGKKYHKDKYCAGKTGFEMTLETAKLLRAPCNICA